MNARTLFRNLVLLTLISSCLASQFPDAASARQPIQQARERFRSAQPESGNQIAAVSAGLSFFHAEGGDLVSDTTGEKITFRGVSLNGLEFGSFESGYPYTGVEGINYFRPRPIDFDDIQALGINVIRIPFEWARLIKGWDPTKPLPTSLDAAYLGILDEVVQSAAARQIYVVLDMHDFLKYWSGQSAQVCVDTNSGYQQLLAQTWKLLAAHFADNQAVLGYDIQNEPIRKEGIEPCSSCNWHTIAQSVVDAIRTVDANHLVFIEGQNYSLASNWPAENGKTPFITDRIAPPRIVYSPHVFFDLNNDSKYDPSEAAGPIGQWQYYMRDRLMPVIDWGRDNNVPIFFGETNVPCSANWVTVLDSAFINYFDPLHLSAMVWHYIDPAHCDLSDPNCALNIAACAQGYQRNVLARHLGGAYNQTGSFIPTPTISRLYDDEPVSPWGVGSFDDMVVDLSATNPLYEGTHSISVSFNRNNFAGLKLFHNYGLDTRRFKRLTFAIFLTGLGQQNFKIFTTSPRSDCVGHDNDPVYPPNFEQRPELRSYLPSLSPAQWLRVEIPLNDIVNPNEPIMNGIAFQNKGSSQEVFYLDGIRLKFSSVEPFDFDGDTKTDLAIWRPSNGGWYIINSATGGSRVQGWGVSTDKLVSADYDGDGQIDLAIWRPSDGTWWIINSSNGSVRVFSWGVSTDIPVPADYDGDGKADLAVWRPSGGFWYIINSSTGGVRVQAWGVSTDVPVAGDYDGDGKADMAIWRPSDGTWWIINSSTSAARSQPWGVDSDKPVPADYDGDGKTDLAVWRPSNGGWYIINSATGGSRVQGWGVSTDKLVPADYDGDGKADIAIWRPADGNWWIINSSNGSVRIFNWGINGDVPVPSAFIR